MGEAPFALTASIFFFMTIICILRETVHLTHTNMQNTYVIFSLI
jgi:hypothetical protein